MEDKRIVELYWQRDEKAIDETQLKYGRLCYSIAYNILRVREDSEECVNDTYLNAWNSMPPQRPNNLAAFLAALTRCNALDAWRKKKAQRRTEDSVALTLEELSECLPEETAIEKLTRERLADAINSFLEELGEEERNFFIRRYWYFNSVPEISKVYGVGESKVRMRLMRTRNKLAAHLEKEGITV